MKRDVDSLSNSPGPIRVYRPRKQEEGQVFHEAIPAARPLGLPLPGISETQARVGLAALAIAVSIAVLGLSLTQLMTPTSEQQSSEATQTLPGVPESQPAAAQLSDEGGAMVNSQEVTQSEGAGEAGTAAPATGGTTGGGGSTTGSGGGSLDPGVQTQTCAWGPPAVGYICVNGLWVIDPKLQSPVPGA
jgi:hypothetical protein